MKNKSFAEKMLGNTFFAILDLVLIKAGTTLVFILLVRMLTERDIAMIGIGMGWLVFVSYFNVGPIRVLLRDYPKIVHDRRKRDQLLSAMLLFWGFQSLVMLLFYFVAMLSVLNEHAFTIFSFLFFGMIIDFIGVTFQEWIRIVFYTAFKQSVVTKISFLFSLVRLVSYGLLFLNPSLANYTWLLLATSAIGSIIWGIAFQRQFHFCLVVNDSILRILKESLSGYGLWDHLNRMTVDTLFNVDIVILEWFTSAHFQDIGSYTIALKVTSLLLLVPIQLFRSLQVVLSNFQDRYNRIEAIYSYIKVNTLISFAQLLGILFFGNWLVSFLFGSNNYSEVMNYIVILAVGVTIMNLTWPLIGIANSFCSLRRVFMYVFLPALVFGLTTYIYAAIYWGPIGVAYGNIVAYTFLGVGLIMFTSKQYPFPLEFKFISISEKRLLRSIVSSIAGVFPK